MRLFITGFLFIVMALGARTVPAREFFITPDGETIYISEKPRVFFLRRTTLDEKPWEVFAPAGKGPNAVQDPQGIDVDRMGRVIIADAGRGGLSIFTPQGRALRFVRTGSGDSAVQRPGSCAATAFGEFAVIDQSRAKVIRLDRSGETLGELSAPVPKEEAFDAPRDLATGPDGSLYAVDAEKNRIYVFGHDGRFEHSFGGFGDGKGRLNRPLALAFGAGGEIWAADSQNHRICAFTRKGRFLSAFGVKGNQRGQLTYPHALAAAPGGMLAVADDEGRRVQFFSATGTWMGEYRFPADKAGNSEANIKNLAFDQTGALYIIDGVGKRVLKILPQIVEDLGYREKKPDSEGADPGLKNVPPSRP